MDPLLSLYTKSKKFRETSGGSRILPEGVRQLPKLLLFFKICRKLHENERIWTHGGGGGGVSLVPPLDPPMETFIFIECWYGLTWRLTNIPSNYKVKKNMNGAHRRDRLQFHEVNFEFRYEGNQYLL